MQTRIYKMNEESIDYKGINECAHIIRGGGIVAFPTETVYGLGARKDSKKAINRLYEIKKRPKGKPFTIHIGSYHAIEDFTPDNSVAIYKLIDKFWPGPLTLILKAKARNETIGLRCPDNKIAQELINRSVNTIVATSANLTSQESAIDSAEVLDNFQGKIEAIIDGGKTKLGAASSIVDFSSGPPRFLRIAAIEKEKMEEVMNRKVVLFVCTGNSCRSVMASALLEKKLKESGKDKIDVIDAGTGALFAMGPSTHTTELLAGEGIDVSSHRSSQLNRRMIRKADLILVMAKIHKEQILALVPEVGNRLYLLKELALGEDDRDVDIADPIGQSLTVYESCFNIIKQSIERVSEVI